MTTKAKFCDTGDTCVINKEGVMIIKAIHLVKGVAGIDICDECCELGVQKIFEKAGFKEEFKKVVRRLKVIA